MFTQIRTKLLSPRILLITWLCFLLSPLLNIFRLYFVIKHDLLPFDLRGFSSLLLYFPIACSVFAAIVLILWFKEYIDKRLTPSHINSLRLLTIYSLCFLVVDKYLLVLEEKNYPNYVYEHFGIIVSQLELMFFVNALQITFFIFVYSFSLSSTANKKINKGLQKYKKSVSVNKIGNSIYFMLMGISILIVNSFGSFLHIPTMIRQELGGFESRVGPHYKYIKAIIDNVPESSNVIHPPQGSKWPAIGNQPILRYFLFPRVLISGALLNNYEIASKIDMAYFVLIDPEFKDTRWPDIDSLNKNIVFDEINEVNYSELIELNTNSTVKVYKVIF